MNTVTERARNGFEHFIANAVDGSLAGEGARCELQRTDCGDAVEKEAVLLTISSYRFRALLFIHFENDEATREFFGALARRTAADVAGERFLDVVMERGNLLCGALNRDLAEYFPHIGMSTPCVLSRSAVSHLAALRPAHMQCYRVNAASAVSLHLTLAVCPDADLDFPFQPKAEALSDSAGELEMF